MWDGIKRRSTDAEDSREKVEPHNDSTSILLELQSLNQTLQKQIAPLVEKHDLCLYGEKGTNGMSKDVNDLKAGLIMLRYVGYGLSVVFTLAIGLVALFRK